MDSNQQLNFLQEKIREIGSAIFYNQSDSLLKLPTSIVRTLKVDDYGCVWFFVQKPKQHLQEFEMAFPVRLDFYKKGASNYLQISGKGWVVSDPEEINGYTDFTDQMRHIALADMVLIKVRIQKADYYESRSQVKYSWWRSAVHTVSSWFRHSQSNLRQETFYPAS